MHLFFIVNSNLEKQATTLFNNALRNANSISYIDLGSQCTIKGGKRLPKGINLVTKQNSHPYIRVRNLNNAIFASLTNDYEYVDDETYNSISKYIVSVGDVLISIVGTIGLTAIVDESLNNANLTENCVKITDLKGITSEYLLLYLRSTQGIEFISKGTVGAVQLKLPIKNIQALPVPLISDDSLCVLEDVLTSLFVKIAANILETKKLSNIRDVLLPKLLSGKLDVSAFDL